MNGRISPMPLSLVFETANSHAKEIDWDRSLTTIATQVALVSVGLPVEPMQHPAFDTPEYDEYAETYDRVARVLHAIHADGFFPAFVEGFQPGGRLGYSLSIARRYAAFLDAGNSY